MRLSQDEVSQGLVAEMRCFHSVVAGLTDQEWAAPTRCEGWSVADVTAHLTGAMADITAGRLEGIDTQPWYDRQVAERRGLPRQAVVDELSRVISATETLMGLFDQAAWEGPAGPGVPGTLGAGIEALWCGTYIHNEDVMAALGRPPQAGPGLRAAISNIVRVLEERGWGPATLDLRGFGEVDVGGGGRRIEADALAFVLVASGRADPSSLGLDGRVNIYG